MLRLIKLVDRIIQRCIFQPLAETLNARVGLDAPALVRLLLSVNTGALIALALVAGEPLGSARGLHEAAIHAGLALLLALGQLDLASRALASAGAPPRGSTIFRRFAVGFAAAALLASLAIAAAQGVSGVLVALTIFAATLPAPHYAALCRLNNPQVGAASPRAG